MRKTILTLTMMLMMALTAIAVPATPSTTASSTAQKVALKSDSAVALGNEAVQNVKEKINDALDDTLTTGMGSGITFDEDMDFTPEDMKELSAQWADVVKGIAYASIWGLLALVGVILLFRYLTRRRRYRVIERAIENNYPLERLPLGDSKHSAIYVQQPVMPPVQQYPAANAAPQQPSRATVGRPLEGQPLATPVGTTGMVNWRALLPAIQWIGAGIFFFLFGVYYAELFAIIGVVLIFTGLCKGFILYNEQKALQEAWRRAEQQRSQAAPMPESTPVPPTFTENNEAND